MNTRSPIAIVGIGCRLPGGISSAEELWSFLRAGKNAGGPIDDANEFDPAFFGISQREAEAIDPQHRWLLEVSREAMEDAFLRPSELLGTRTGVFIGQFASAPAAPGPQTMLDYLGTSRSGAAGRIAYHYDLRGPCSVIDTDRSSGLVALHEACVSLDAGDCDIAIVGAANLSLDAGVTAIFQDAGMLAPDGRCKFADRNADGFVRSEGVVALVLMHLERGSAIAGRTYAVLRGTAVASSGRAAGDLMAQSPDAQASLLAHAYARAGISPRQLTYVEAHGTGTPHGDRAELAALARVLRDAGRSDPCWVGSVKTNLGHCEPCAGLVGTIKAALCAKHGEIPASLHFEAFPQGLDVADLLRVPSEPVAVPRDTFVSGVSSFGLTGINAHLVLTGAPLATHGGPPPAGNGPHVVCLSAATEASLRSMAERTAKLLNGGARVEDVCGSAAIHRDPLAHRAVAASRTAEDLAGQLRAFASGTDRSAAITGRAGWSPGDKIAFVFPGQGSQWAGMGLRLLEENEAFARKLEACDVIVGELAGWSILAELRSRRAIQGATLQPILAATEIALAAMWESWGVRPDVVVGASMGETVAAHVAGALSLRDALRIIVTRARLMERVRGGAVAVVEQPVDRLLPRLDARLVSISAYYSEAMTGISGDHDTVTRLVREFSSEGIFARLVRMEVASHSPNMDPILAPLCAELGDLSAGATAVPMFSTVFSRYVEGTELGAKYWAHNLRDPVQFAGAVRALAADGVRIFLEVSPHPTLRTPMIDVLESPDTSRLVAHTMDRGGDELLTARTALGRLHVFGYPVPWERSLPAFAPIRLPRYAWDNVPFGALASSSASSASSTSSTSSTSSAREAVARHGELGDELRALPRTARQRALTNALAQELAHVLRAPLASIDVDRPMRDHGLTSASATDLRVTMGRWLGKKFTASVVFSYPTVRALAAHLASECAPPTEGAPPAGSAPPAPRDAATAEPLAIVGMALRFPGGAGSAESFWRVLVEGRDAITEVPEDRWDAGQYYDRDPRAPGKMPTKWGGFLDDVAGFDADFFGISPKEAESMDPRQRLLLELSWEALEDAGSSRSRIAGTATGVFMGLMNNNEYASRRRSLHDVVAHSSTGEATSIAAGRISYVFGLHGPALVVDTACSSSLVALHLAVQSLRRGECTMALVGGANLIAHPETSLAFAKTRMLSPTGRCKTFDASADGYVRAEGACVLVLKRLSSALADADRILALVRGTAVNHDGRSSGLTAPSGKAQEALLRQALADAGVSPEDISYIEAHGTGTALGDPIEVDALVAAFAPSRREVPTPLVVGSVKANIGHLEACAGLGGLAKVVLAMRHRTIPRQIHLQTLNPKLTVPDWLRFPRDSAPWSPPPRMARLLAGVSSFGFSGTNAHVILEEPPSLEVTPEARGLRRALAVLPISAATPQSLAVMAARYAEAAHRWNSGEDATALAACATRREHLPIRAAAVGTTPDALRDQLRALASERKGDPPTPPVLAFVYGASSDGIFAATTQLWADEPVYRDAIDLCSGTCGYAVDPILTRHREARSPAERDVAIFSAQYALTALMAHMGIVPEYVTGAGVGELAAANAAGILDLATALALAARREGVTVTTSPARLSFVAGRSGARDPADPDYWTHEENFRPDDASRALAAAGCNVFAIVGDEASVRLHEGPTSSPRECITVLGEAPFAVSVARLFTAGLEIDWRRFYEGCGRTFSPFPPYAFEHKTYWRKYGNEENE